MEQETAIDLYSPIAKSFVIDGFSSHLGIANCLDVHNKTMRLFLLVVALLSLSQSSIAQRAGPVEQSQLGLTIYTELTRYYIDRSQVPHFATRDAPLDVPAVERVLILLKQLERDRSTRAPVDRTPFWGGSGSKSTADNLTAQIIESLSVRVHTATELPIAAWLLGHVDHPKAKQLAVDILVASSGESSSTIMLEAIARPIADPAILTEFIKELGNRNTSAAIPRLLTLALHPNEIIRQAAVEALVKLNQKPPKYDPKKGALLLTEEFVEFIKEVALDIPKDLRTFTKHISTSKPNFPGHGSRAYTTETFGWRIALDGTVEGMITQFGTTIKTNTAFEYTTINFEFVSLEAYARKLIAARKELNSANFDRERNVMPLFSQEGTLTSQFEGPGISIPEALIGLALWENGDKGLASDVFATTSWDLAQINTARASLKEKFGRVSHEAMLNAFARDKNYPQAIRYADHICRPVFNGYGYQGRACELAEQLRLRAKDFKELSLPNTEEWTKLKQTKNQVEQIAFLGERMRLLQAFQWGQPGSVDFEGRLADRFPRAQRRSKKTSPGSVNHESEEPPINPFRELKLSASSVEHIEFLAPFLEDYNYVLAYGYWRDFHPGRSLYRVNELIAGHINALAHSTLVKISEYSAQNEDARRTDRERLIAWARKHAKDSPIDLSVTSARETSDGHAFSQAIESLITAKDIRAAELAKRSTTFDEYVENRVGLALAKSDLPELRSTGADVLIASISRSTHGYNIGLALDALVSMNDKRIIKLIERRLNEKALQHDTNSLLGSLALVDASEARALAARWLKETPRPNSAAEIGYKEWPGNLLRRFWLSVSLARGDSKEKLIAEEELQKIAKIFEDRRLTLDINIHDWNPGGVASHMLAALPTTTLLNRLDTYSPSVATSICSVVVSTDVIAHIKKCFARGSASAKAEMVRRIKDEKVSSSGFTTDDKGKVVHHTTTRGDDFTSALQPFGPEGFTFDKQSSDNEEKARKRAELIAWIERQ